MNDGRTSDIDYKLRSSFKVLSTSESGDRLTNKDNILFSTEIPEGSRVIVRPDLVKQEIDGIGTSFTESSAFVLAHLSPAKRCEVMNKVYGHGEGCAGFTLTRTHIGSCDFSVEGKYSYQDSEKDQFSLAPDQAGFRDEKAYPKVRDRDYDLLPMIKEALGINPDIRIIASAWTAPPWMKDVHEWFIKGYTNGQGVWHNGTGGSLLDEHYPTYARYIRKYIDSYAKEDVSIWGVTPVNEPLGVGGQWESMHWAAEEEAAFIRDYLGPVLEQTGVRILPYDQNRGDDLKRWADAIYAEMKTADYVYGMAVHWYSSTIDARTGSLDYVHEKAPGKTIIHTEGCIDCLGRPAPGGVADPAGYQEKNWWKNDSFWWNDNATDWAYQAYWGDWLDPDDHPKYTAVHRYARNIIDSLNHWVSGWVDWNIVLDKIGGPNHVGNFCGAPIMIDTDAKNPDDEIYYTPVFYTLAQLSSNIQPGDRVLQSYVCGDGRLGDDDLHALATMSGGDIVSIHLLNTTKEPRSFNLQIGIQSAPVTMDANSVRTIKVKLGGVPLSRGRQS